MLQLSLTILVIASTAISVLAYPKPQEPQQSEAVLEEAVVPDSSKSKFEGSQLGLALQLSNAKPQEVSASSYAGRRKRAPQTTEDEVVNAVPQQEPESSLAQSKFEGSQLGLALQLSNAKPQEVSASSYAG